LGLNRPNIVFDVERESTAIHRNRSFRLEASAPTKVDERDGPARRCLRRALSGADVVEIDTDKIDEAVLALLYLTLHDRFRAWKGFDWDALDRLYRKGLICDPVGKAKSVVLTDEGLAESERLFRELFAKPSASDEAAARSRQ